MSHTTQHGDPTEAAKPERLRFSLAQLFGFLLAIALVLGTLRLVITIPLWSSWAGGIGFAAAALVFLRAINVKASLIEYAVVALIIGLVAAWLMPAVHAAKEAPSRMPRPTRNYRVPSTEIFALERTAILTTARRRKESLRTIQCHQTWSG